MSRAGLTRAAQRLITDLRAELAQQKTIAASRVSRLDYDRAIVRIEKLESAILRHRLQTWGAGPVGTAADMDLYREALGNG